MTHAARFLSVVRSQGRRARIGGVSGIACLMLGASALSACGSGMDENDSERLVLSSAEQPILGGELDDEHPQVMGLSLAGLACTGTVIHVDGRSGYLLTAAHCVTERDRDGTVVPVDAGDLSVVAGPDLAESSESFPVVAVHVEPNYDGTFATNDVAVVRFVILGIAPTVVAIPPLSASDDELGLDAELLLVGYGRTDTDNANTKRHRVERQVEILEEKRLAYSQTDGKGACFGDSGGPGLVEVDGAERVAVVISGSARTNGTCASGIGVAMRVSAFEDLIDSALD